MFEDLTFALGNPAGHVYQFPIISDDMTGDWQKRGVLQRFPRVSSYGNGW